MYDQLKNCFLILIILGSFLVGQKILAVTYQSDDFEDCSLGGSLYACSGFTKYSTSQDFTIKTGTTTNQTKILSEGYAEYVGTTTQTHFSLDVLPKNLYTGNNFLYFSAYCPNSTTKIKAGVRLTYVDPNFYDMYIVRSTATTTQADRVYLSINGNYWHTVHLDFNYVTRQARVRLDDSAGVWFDLLDVLDCRNVDSARNLRISAIMSGSSDEVWVDNFVADGNSNLEEANVEIIELPDPEDATIQIGSSEINYQKDIYCYYDQTDCKIKFDYRYEDIGSMAILLPATATSVTQYVDVITELADKNLLQDYLSPTVRSSLTDDEYRILVSPDTGSSTLTDVITVHWISSSTDIVQLTGIMQYFKNIFPLGIFFQMKNLLSEVQNSQEMSLTWNDFVPPEYSGISSNAKVLDAQLVRDNLPIFETKIIPFMEMVLWILGALYTFFRIKSVLTSDSSPE